MFDSLLATGLVNVDEPDQFGMSPFWYFYTNARLQEAFYLVEKHNANINHIDNYGMFALKRELYQTNLATFRTLLEKGANPNMVDEFQRSVLHLACDYAHRKDYREFLKLLLKHGADLQQPDFKERTAIHYLFVHRNKRYEVSQYEPLTVNHGAQG